MNTTLPILSPPLSGDTPVPFSIGELVPTMAEDPKMRYKKSGPILLDFGTLFAIIAKEHIMATKMRPKDI